MAYRSYKKKYTVYVFSRRNRLPEEFSTRDMAADQAEAMKLLGISRADVMGVSQGGMIAQYLAIDFPEMVNILVLAVTLARQNETIAGSRLYVYKGLGHSAYEEAKDFKDRVLEFLKE